MIAFSTICYTHGKLLGIEQASRILQTQVQGGQVRGAPMPRCIETVHKLGQLFGDLEQIAIRIDPNGSSLGKARARAFHWAFEQETASVWVSCDDDCTASPGTLQTLVRLTRETDRPRVVVVPFGLRGADDSDRSQVNIRYRAGNNEERGALLPITAGGFGLVAVNRLAMNVIHEVRPSWLDDDNTLRTLLFNCECELTAGGAEWLGEDFSFFKQVRDHVDCWALIRGESDHAGTIIDLGEVGALFS